MAKSYFAILKVTSSATPDEIHSAYRRLAKQYHPDYYGGGSEPFQEIQEAYSVLADPARRKAYEKTLSDLHDIRAPHHKGYPESKPEPLIPETKPADMAVISPIRSFERFSPSLGDIYDWLESAFRVVGLSSSEPVQNPAFEVPLNREQTLRGGKITVMVPVRTVCPTCRGYGDIGFYDCRRCAGKGIISGEVPISVKFPPGLTRDYFVIIPLDRLGAGNFHFTVQFHPFQFHPMDVG